MVTKNSNDKYLELKDSIVKIEYELRIANERIVRLQSELDQVSSLRAHIKKYIKKHLKHVDQKIEFHLQPHTLFEAAVPDETIEDLVIRANYDDELNLTRIMNSHKVNRKLRLYKTSKAVLKRYLKKVKY